jgi:hypothetical protein
MKSFVSAALSAAMIAGSLVAFAAPADAQRGGSRMERERYVQNYCSRNSRDRDCRDFRSNRHRWDDRRYQSWYRSHHRNNGEQAVAAIFGFAAGVVAGTAGAVSSGSHHVACETRYDNYDSRSNTYVGRDGRRYRCQ